MNLKLMRLLKPLHINFLEFSNYSGESNELMNLLKGIG